MSETLETKVQRLNRYHRMHLDLAFDRLYPSLCREVAQQGKQLHYQHGWYKLQEGTSVQVTLPGWIASILGEENR